MAAVWADTTRFGRWLEVELLATEAHAELGIVPAADAAACRERAPVVDDAFVAAVLERERTTDHDVAAFVDVVQGAIGAPAGSWIHYGLTSSDVVDTALCWAMRDAADLVLTATDALLATLVELARTHLDTVMIGRTHGIHAEPTTFGAKVALWALQLDRDRTRLRAARRSVAVCKLSGAVGTYSNVDPAVEAHVGARSGCGRCRRRRSSPATATPSCSTRSPPIAATCELVAVELRHLQRTEVGEVLEGFKAGQKGSSAMPHKRNPISAETISGLARVVRSNLLAGLQDVALWHERDISHSSVERVILPDSSLLVHYMVGRLERLLRGLQVERRPDAREPVVEPRPRVQPAGAAGAGGRRHHPRRRLSHRAAQRHAGVGGAHGISGRCSKTMPMSRLSKVALDDAFDLQRSLRHLDRVAARSTNWVRDRSIPCGHGRPDR